MCTWKLAKASSRLAAMYIPMAPPTRMQSAPARKRLQIRAAYYPPENDSGMLAQLPPEYFFDRRFHRDIDIAFDAEDSEIVQVVTPFR